MSYKLTDWSNEPTIDELKVDYDTAEAARSSYVADLLRWDLIRRGGKELDSANGTRSTVRVKVVRKHEEWKVPDLEEPFLNSSSMFEATPRTSEDVESAEWNSAVLNYQWENKVGKTHLIGSMCRRLYSEGTAVLKVGWEYQEGLTVKEIREPVYAQSEEEAQAKIQQLLESNEIDETKAKELMASGKVPVGYINKHIEIYAPTINQPKYELCENGNILADPTCTTKLSDAQYVIYDYDSSYAELKQYEYVEREDGSTFGYYHNLDQIKDNMEELGWDNFKPAEYNSGNMEDFARKKFKVSEYWGYKDIHGTGELVSIVATWVGNVLIRLSENPFPHKKIPFTSAAYMPIKDSYRGEPDAELLEEHQKAISRNTRAMDDIISTIAVNQTLIDERLLPTQPQQNAFKRGEDTTFTSGMDPARAIHRMKVEAPPPALYDMIQLNMREVENIIGTRPFAGANSGASSALSATATRGAIDASGKRSLSVMRRINEMLADVAKMTISMNQKFLSEEEIIRVTNREFVTVRRDDLQGDFDIRINVSTPEKDAENAERLMVLLQTQAANMSPDVQKAHYIQLAKLMNQDHLAKTVAETDTGPSEADVELQKLNMENARLLNIKLKKEIEEIDSRIDERVSRTEENTDADTSVKLAKAKETLAKARKIEAETEVIEDLYMRQVDGVEDQKALDKEIREQIHSLQVLQEKNNQELRKVEALNNAKLTTEQMKLEAGVRNKAIDAQAKLDTADSNNKVKLLIEQIKLNSKGGW
jgi:hypothetical protein